jgi:glycosyltransferase involved in cell wall biosynthesis
MRERALVVTPRLPWPLDDGGRIGLWQAMWSVAQRFDTTLVTLEVPGESALAPPPEVERLGIEVVRVPHRVPPLPVALARGTFGRWPFTLARFHSPALGAELRRLVAARSPRFAHVNHLAMATHLDALSGTAVVLREHNVEHIWLARYAEQLRNPLARLYALDQARRMRATEARLCESADLVLAIQDNEAATLRGIAPRARVEVVPIGVEFSRFLPHAPSDPPTVLLVGTFSWPPNVEGARRFLDEGWPRVRARHPGARLRLVGKAMPADLAESARRAGAEPVGYVEDMAVEFAAARALVVPLWAGAGARVKIVEALAAGVPVVSTPLGSEGLGLRPGVHDLEADAAAGLGDAVARMLSDQVLAFDIGRAGRSWAEERFSLERVAARTCALCESASPH